MRRYQLHQFKNTTESYRPAFRCPNCPRNPETGDRRYRTIKTLGIYDHIFLFTTTFTLGTFALAGNKSYKESEGKPEESIVWRLRKFWAGGEGGKGEGNGEAEEAEEDEENGKEMNGILKALGLLGGRGG